MTALVIRKATDSDNDQILALFKRCPQVGMISFLFHRTPRFNTINRLLDPDSWHFVACDGNRIVGVVGVMFFPALVLGKPRKVAYILDLLLDSDFRRGTTAFRMIKRVVQELYNSDADFALANFLKDNQHPLVFAKGRAGFNQALYLGDNQFYSMLSLRKRTLSNRYEIGQPTMQDLPELVELYQRHARQYKLAEIITLDKLQHYISQIEGLTLSNFLIAKQAGRIRAVTAMWDEIAYKCYEVQKLTPAISMVTGLLKVASLFARVPKPIQLHQPLNQLSLVLSAHDSLEAQEDLFRHVNNLHRGSNYTLITLYAQENDPLTSIIRKFRGISVKSEMHAFAREPEILEELQLNPAPVLFNLALLQ